MQGDNCQPHCLQQKPLASEHIFQNKVIMGAAHRYEPVSNGHPLCDKDDTAYQVDDQHQCLQTQDAHQLYNSSSIQLKLVQESFPVDLILPASALMRHQ